MRQKLLDWLQVLAVGALIGVAATALLTLWVWWRHGEVTVARLELPLYGMAALLLLTGAGMFSGVGAMRGTRGTWRVLADTRSNPRPSGGESARTLLHQAATGAYLIAAGIWCMVYLFAWDLLSR